MADKFSARYGDLLSGSYDCVDRIVLNGYMSLCHSPGGFRVWWRRLHHGSDEELDNTHLMRLAGRFSRRVRAWGKANAVPVIRLPQGRAQAPARRRAPRYPLGGNRRVHGPGGQGQGAGGTCSAPSRASSATWPRRRPWSTTTRSTSWTRPGATWSSRSQAMAPFGAQIMLNGHEYVSLAAEAAGIAFTKEGNCFTEVVDPTDLAQVADTLSAEPAIGRLSQVCDRWIYSACLCFGLTLEEQEASSFGYGYSIYQVEYSRNLLFHVGAQMEAVFNTVVDRSRSRLDVATLRTLFGTKRRPRIKGRADLSTRVATVIETPRHDLSILEGPLRPVDAQGLHQRRTRAALRGDRPQHQDPASGAGAGALPRHRVPPGGHGAALL
jgi:hypothetical protein